MGRGAVDGDDAETVVKSFRGFRCSDGPSQSVEQTDERGGTQASTGLGDGRASGYADSLGAELSSQRLQKSAEIFANRSVGVERKHDDEVDDRDSRKEALADGFGLGVGERMFDILSWQVLHDGGQRQILEQVSSGLSQHWLSGHI
jgi:hypothetical protein